MKIWILAVSIIFTLPVYSGGFDFGDLTKDGSGSFNQPVTKNGVKRVPGVIPKGVKNLRIYLKSSRDVDVRLYDIDDNSKPIVGWNIGALIGDDYNSSTASYKGVTITYSGFNGDCPEFSGDYSDCSSGKSPGNEYIEITGITKNRFIMTAYGYNSGTAKINYSWKGVASNVTTRKNGSFTSTLTEKKRSYLGIIPAGIDNPVVFLKATNDLDIELYDAKTNEFVVGWKSDHIDSYTKITGSYKKDKITWSGWGGRYYAGSQIPKDKKKPNGAKINAYISNDTKTGINKSLELGREYIRIHGKSKNGYKMYVFAYKAGSAEVEYSWGINPIYAGLIGLGKDYLGSESNNYPNMYPAINGLMPELMSRYNGAKYSGYGRTNLQANKAASGVNPILENGGTYEDWRNTKGVAGIAIKLSNYSRGAGDINAFSSGNVKYIYNKIKAQINENSKNMIFLAGHSSGGGDAQDILWKFNAIGQSVKASFQIDSIETEVANWGDARIPSNTEHAYNYWEDEVWYVVIGPRESSIYADDSDKTTIKNTYISNPTCNTDGNGSCKEGGHGAIDNDNRVWGDIILKIKGYTGIKFGFFE